MDVVPIQYQYEDRLGTTHQLVKHVECWNQDSDNWGKGVILTRLVSLVALPIFASVDAVAHVLSGALLLPATLFYESIGWIELPSGKRLRDSMSENLSAGNIMTHACKAVAYVIEAVATPILGFFNPLWVTDLHDKLLIMPTRKELLTAVPTEETTAKGDRTSILEQETMTSVEKTSLLKQEEAHEELNSELTMAQPTDVTMARDVAATKTALEEKTAMPDRAVSKKEGPVQQPLYQKVASAEQKAADKVVSNQEPPLKQKVPAPEGTLPLRSSAKSSPAALASSETTPVLDQTRSRSGLQGKAHEAPRHECGHPIENTATENQGLAKRLWEGVSSLVDYVVVTPLRVLWD